MIMYLEHFGLREPPFGITPHTDFFFSGANRRATLDALIYAITHDEGVIKVSGEVGSGKTMLCRMLLEKLPDDVETVCLAPPLSSGEDVLHAIAEELQTPLPEMRAHRLMRALQKRLIELYSAGRRIVVLIDEAHAMPAETLEEIRLLSNLESNRHKLLHIVLFGQPELDDRLASRAMRPLRERITHNFVLEPLSREEIADYLAFRLHAAGYRGPDLFTPAAIKLISRASRGYTRRINIIADKALLSAFAEAKHLIDTPRVQAAIRDARFDLSDSPPGWRQRWLWGTLAMVPVAAFAFLAIQHYPRPPQPDQLAPATATSTPPAATPETGPGTALAQLPTAMQTSDPSAAPAVPETMEDRVQATEAWLRTAPDSHFFIQLLSTGGDNQREIEEFLAAHSKLLEPDQLRVYRSSLSGKKRLGVIYGDFASQEEATRALAQLPPQTRAAGPYIRAVRKLR